MANHLAKQSALATDTQERIAANADTQLENGTEKDPLEQSRTSVLRNIFLQNIKNDGEFTIN